MWLPRSRDHQRRDCAVAEEQITLVCANALHHKWTHEELAAGLGEDIVRRFAKRLR
jgi:nickel-dependent lactate racemase